MGEATAAMARADPDRDIVGVEVHPAGVAALLRRIEEASLTNVRVVEGDAVQVLEACPAGSLAEVRVFFPDPWPKARHAKRRLLRRGFTDLLATRLAPGGFLHLATDSSDYAEHALLALAGWDAEVVPRPERRPETGYELRALAAGRGPIDVIGRPPAG